MKHLITILFAFLLSLSLTACSASYVPSASTDTAAAQGSESLSTSDGVVGTPPVEDSKQEEISSVTQAVPETSESDSPQNTPSAKSTAPVHHNDAVSQIPSSSQDVSSESSSESPSSIPVQPAVPSQPEENTSSKPVFSDQAATAPSDLPQQVIQLVNQERSKAGLAPLAADTQLNADALVRARETTKVFDHVRPNGSSFATAVTIEWGTVGENIAWGQNSAQMVMNTWMNSPGHRQNILSSSYTKNGVGVAEENGKLYWVQLFVG